MIEESDKFTAAVASVAALVASLCSSSCISGAQNFLELLGGVFRFHAASSILVPAVPVGISDVEAVEGLNRHVLAGSLFSGVGEQASGRVNIPGKDIQQQAAAANETICFFVKSLGGASSVVKLENHATVARVKQHVALKSGVCEDAFYLVWEGKVLRDGDALGRLGVVRDTQLHMSSYLRGGLPNLWHWEVLANAQSCYRCGAPRQGGIGGQRPPRESHCPGQPSNQGLPINPTKRVLRGFNGGNSQFPPKVVPSGPLLAATQGLADPAVVLPLLQSLGLPEEVLEVVRAKIATQKAPKKVSREKQLSLLRAKIDVVAQQIARLNKTVLHHQEKLRESEEAPLDKTIGACTARRGIP